MGLGRVFALTPHPPPAPEVLGPFRLFTTVCCGNGRLHGPGGSRCRGNRKANQFMQVNSLLLIGTPWGGECGPEQPGKTRSAMEGGLTSREV